MPYAVTTRSLGFGDVPEMISWLSDYPSPPSTERSIQVLERIAKLTEQMVSNIGVAEDDARYMVEFPDLVEATCFKLRWG